MELVTPHLSSVLQTYQHSATRSLHGPGAAPGGGAAPGEGAAPRAPSAPSPRPAPPPVLSAADPARGERGETALEGEAISCFSVGGERRLCLPQILTSVLTDFSLDQINRVCDELQIYCSRCTPAQLHELKAEGVLPRSAPSCGLITHTDAERLCAALLHRAPAAAPAPAPAPAARGFRVYHECFGRCRGVCVPELFVSRAAACIECAECRALLSPQRFVCHAHRDLENRTCHWGFDSSRWRAYLRVARDQPERDKCAALLDDMQARCERVQPQPQPHPQPLLKRKQVVEQPLCKSEPPDLPHKKLKSDDAYSAYAMYIDPYVQLQAAAIYDRYRALSTFRPWSSKRPFLTHEPPALQHPERVVRLADSARFERTYQPNVALKPLTPPSSDEITSSTSPPEASAATPSLAASPPPRLASLPPSEQTSLLDAERAVAERAARLAQREAELDEREAELARREARLAMREAELRRLEGMTPTDELDDTSPSPC